LVSPYVRGPFARLLAGFTILQVLGNAINCAGVKSAHAVGFAVRTAQAEFRYTVFGGLRMVADAQFTAGGQNSGIRCWLPLI